MHKLCNNTINSHGKQLDGTAKNQFVKYNVTELRAFCRRYLILL